MAKPNKPTDQLKCAEKARWVTNVEARHGDVFCHDGAGADDDMIADCNRKDSGIRTYGYMITDNG